MLRLSLYDLCELHFDVVRDHEREQRQNDNWAYWQRTGSGYAVRLNLERINFSDYTFDADGYINIKVKE